MSLKDANYKRINFLIKQKKLKTVKELILHFTKSKFIYIFIYT